MNWSVAKQQQQLLERVATAHSVYLDTDNEKQVNGKNKIRTMYDLTQKCY